MKRNWRNYAAFLVLICATVGCYEKSAFLCSDGAEDGDRVCRDGVFVPKVTDRDVGRSDVGLDMRPGSDTGDCVPEIDADFCERLGKNCEDVTAQDNCGQFRTVNCGICDGDGLECGGGGTANVCGCPDLSDEVVCNGSTCGIATADCQGTSFDVNCGACGANSTCDDVNMPMMCVCDSGYEPGAADCRDIDECATNVDNCDPVSQVCVNEPGTFSCDCAPGYVLVGNTCEFEKIVLFTDRLTLGMQAATSATADISATFPDTTNVVPFASASFVNSGGEARRLMIDVEIDATNVTVSRDDENGDDAFVNVELAHFDPAKVRVQRGTFDIQNGDTSDTVSLGQDVVTANTFVVFYGKTDTNQIDRDNVMVAVDLSTDEIDFDRDGNNGDLTGHFWVVEALNNEFTVQHFGGGPMQDMMDTYTLPTTVTTTDSFLLYSYETDTAENASRGHANCRLREQMGQNTIDDIECSRLSSADEIRNLRFQVVTLSVGTVSRGVALLLGNQASATFVNDVDHTTLLVGHMGAAGSSSADRNATLLWQGMVRGELTAAQILFFRGSDQGSARILWEGIEW